MEILNALLSRFLLVDILLTLFRMLLCLSIYYGFDFITLIIKVSICTCILLCCVFSFVLDLPILFDTKVKQTTTTMVERIEILGCALRDKSMKLNNGFYNTKYLFSEVEPLLL